MGYRYQFIEHNVIHIQWLEKVTIEELEIGVAEITKYINETGNRVYVEIIDLRECTAIPFDLRSLRRVATQDSHVIGYVILKPSNMAKTMASMLKQVTSLPFQVAMTLDEAHTIANTYLDECAKAKD